MVNNRLFLIFFVALALRLTAFFMLAPFSEEGKKETLFSDAVGYHSLAIEIKNNLSFGENNPFLSAIRTPGYPFFIAIWYSMFGENPWVVLLVQIVLDCLLVGLIYFLCINIFNENIAFIAALFYAIDPIVILYNIRLLSDHLFTFLIFVSYLFLWFFFKNKNNRKMYLLLSCIFLAIAAYVRPIGLYLIFANVFLLFFIFKKREKTRYSPILTYFLLFLLLLLPWTYRNYQKHGHWFFSTSANYNSLVLYASEVEATALKTSRETVVKIYKKYFNNQYPEINHFNVYEVHKKYAKKAVETFKQYPIAFAKSYFNGIFDLFFSFSRHIWEMATGKLNPVSYQAAEMIRNNNIEGIKQICNDYKLSTLIYIFFTLSWFVFSYSLSLIGGWYLITSHQKFILLFLSLPIIYFLLMTGQAGECRFKLPIIPFYLILSAIGLQNKWEICKNKLIEIKCSFVVT